MRRNNWRIKEGDGTLGFPTLVVHIAFQKYTNNLIEYQVFDRVWIQQTHFITESKFLAKLLNPLLKDSFEAVDKIHKILVKLFDQGYRYFWFDVTSLFTVFLGKIINVILDRVYKDSIIDTKVENSKLKGATKLQFTHCSCVIILFFSTGLSCSCIFCIFYLLFCEDSFSSFCVWCAFCLFWDLNSTSNNKIIRFRIMAFIESLFLDCASDPLWFCSPFININNKWH